MYEDVPLKEKLQDLKEKIQSLGTKKIIVLSAILLLISSFIGGWLAQTTYNLTLETSLEEKFSVNLMMCPIYAIIRPYGIAYTLISAIGITIAFLIIYLMTGKNEDLNKVKYVDENGVPISKSNLYGSSDWLHREEAEKIYEIGPVDKVDGIILGQYTDKGKEVIAMSNDSPGNRNIAIYGSPGSGKSFGFVRSAIFQSAKNNASMIITDPKGELYGDMCIFLQKQGYDVKLFNLVDLNKSDAWNCATEVINPYTGNVDELRIAEFVDAIMTNSSDGRSDQFWDGGEANLLKAIIFYVAYNNEKLTLDRYKICVGELCRELGVCEDDKLAFMDILDDPQAIMNDKKYAVYKLAKMKAEQDFHNGNIEAGYENIPDSEYAEKWAVNYLADIDDWIDKRAPLRIDEIYRLLLNNDMAAWETCFRDIPLDHPASMAWSIFKQNTENVRPQFITGLGQRLQLFQMKDLRRILRNTDIDLASIGESMQKKKTALFCVLSDKSAAMKPITSLLFNFMFKDISDAADHYGAETRNTVNMILDEFVNIGRIPNFEVVISTVRSRKIGIFMILQTYSQLQETYGETNAETIIGCCDTLLCLGVNDETTANFISNKSGVATVVARSTRDSRLDSIGRRGYTQGYSISDGEGKRNVINPDEVMTMDYNDILIFRQHAHVLKAHKFAYLDHPMFIRSAITLKNGKKVLEQSPYSERLDTRVRYADTEDRDAFSSGTNKVRTTGDMNDVERKNREIANDMATERFRETQKKKIPSAAELAGSRSAQPEIGSGKGKTGSGKKNKFTI